MSLIKTSEEVICRCALCMEHCVFPFDGEEGMPKESEFGNVSGNIMSVILNCPHAGKKDLVIFVGGFMDGIFCCMLKLAKDYYKLNPHQDIWYVSYDSSKQLHKIIKSYNKAGKKIILAGHSWGGDAAAHLLNKNQAIHVDMLATLDPVSKKGPPSKTNNMGEWVNLFVDYSISRAHHANVLAKISGPWGNVANADVNISQQEWGELAQQAAQKQLSQLHHSDVYWMLFCKKLRDSWERILPESNLTPNSI